MGQFSLDLSRLVEKAKGRTDTVVKKVMLEAFSRVVQKSPVDTGAFRGAWIASIGQYSRETPSATDKAGTATIGKITAEVLGMKIGDRTIFLTNNLSYAHVLEYGRSNGQPGSRQAPQGMIRITLAEITSKYGT